MGTSMSSGSTALETMHAALSTAVNTGEVDDWVHALRDPLADPLAAILDSNDLASRLLSNTEYANVVDWLNDIEGWLSLQYRDPRAADDPLTRVLYETWGQLTNSLGRLLTVAKAGSGFPDRGGVLCFAGGLNLCLVVQFQFHRAAPSLTPLVVVRDPKAAFAVWSSIEDQPAARRDALRKMLVSGHKLIFHRGVLVHVDRRENRTVFGPSIDTLVMAELLAEDVYGHGDAAMAPKSFLEIGTGSGMLCAGALTALPRSERIVGVELDFGSVTCTHRNLVVASGGLDPLDRENCTLVAGSFEKARLAGGFDLVACNPPYLPNLAAAPAGRSGSEDYLRAVGGRELIDQILEGLNELLSPNGRLLLMINNMAVDMVESAIPPGFTSKRALGSEGRSVLFEVEALYERPALLAQMQEDGDLRTSGDAFEHTLHPLWIRRQEDE
jgi:methylase of polypeptide subunit release factors